MAKLTDLASSLFAKASEKVGSTSSTSVLGKKKLTDDEVQAALADLASKKGGGGNYKVSIVDLCKLLGLESSLAARKVLAEKLNVHAGEHGTAEQNIALHKALLEAFAANGGEVPADLK